LLFLLQVQLTVSGYSCHVFFQWLSRYNKTPRLRGFAITSWEALAKLFDAVVTIWVELQVSGVFCDFRAVYPLRRLVRMFFEIDLSTARQPRDFLAGVSGSSGDDRKRRYVTKRRI
jgi:hypothetical protein